MSNSISVPAGTPPLDAPRPAVSSDHRVILHEPICPNPVCGSFDITESEVETGDDITEIALTCRACGTAWPVACVVDWSTQP